MVFPSSFYCVFGETQKTCVLLSILYALNFLSFQSCGSLFSPFASSTLPLPSNAAWHAFTSEMKHISILFQDFQHIPARLWRSIGWLLAPDCSYHSVTSTIIQARLHGAACFYHVCAPIGIARLALTQSGLTLAAEGGEGTQAGFQFFHELGAACSQQTVQPCSEGVRGPQHGGRGC